MRPFDSLMASLECADSTPTGLVAVAEEGGPTPCAQRTGLRPETGRDISGDPLPGANDVPRSGREKPWLRLGTLPATPRVFAAPAQEFPAARSLPVPRRKCCARGSTASLRALPAKPGTDLALRPAMETDVRRNPALLKLDLYCKGIRIDESCLLEDDGGRQILRTRAGLGSGVELVLPGGLWTNVPVTEKFAQSSPYVLRRDGSGYSIVRHGQRSPGSGHGPQILTTTQEPVARVTLAPRPSWYDRKTSTGKTMSRVGTLQGTYLGIYPAKVCD